MPYLKKSTAMADEIISQLQEQVRQRIITFKGVRIMLDVDVAELYGVETKRVNEAVKNNSEKFPEDYVFSLTGSELADLRSKISTAQLSSKSRSAPQAFTEKG